jgi:phosphoglycolate phosphatase-like HAD superfamily hydrolase
MSRRSPRVLARFAATVEVGGIDHALICHTKDISNEGCFLETSEPLETGAGITLSIMDNAQGTAVTVDGHITRTINSARARGVGVRLVDPPEEWFFLVERFRTADEGERERPNLRLNILVVSSEASRRGALALYVTSGWDIRFASDVESAAEALGGYRVDAVICEHEAHENEWRIIMGVAANKQPAARRLVRCQTGSIELPESGPGELVHRFVSSEHGMDALLDALTAEIGELKEALTDPLTGALPLSPAVSAKLLRDIVDTIAVQDKAVAVFDLDSTLLDNAPRQSAILREYGAEMGVRELQQSAPEHWTSWDMSAAMSKTGLDPALVAAHTEPFKRYWRERFFTSEYCRVDEMVPGASDFVHSVVQAGGSVYYVTGRHEGMRAGTEECLQRLGFPVPGETRVQLLMKPTLEEHDDAYKRETLEFLATAGTVVAAFDNEPTHINAYRVAFPGAYSVHLATDHSGREVKILEGILSIIDFAATS